jgi:hypothetical protein
MTLLHGGHESLTSSSSRQRMPWLASISSMAPWSASAASAAAAMVAHKTP